MTSTNGTAVLVDPNVLISIALSDAPFLALGFLGLGMLTFYAAMDRLRRAIIFLDSAAILATLAVLIDLVAMFYGNPLHSTAIITPETYNLVTALFIVKQILLAVSVGLRLSFILCHVLSAFSDYRPAMPVTRAEKQRDDKVSAAGRIVRRNVSWSSPRTRARVYEGVLQYLSSALILAIFGLQLGWRLLLQLRPTSSSFFALNIASFALQIPFYILVISPLVIRFFSADANLKLPILKARTGILSGIFLGMAVSIGSLASLGFSETIVGRLLQALQMYILITSTLVLDFTGMNKPLPRPPSDRWTIINTERSTIFRNTRALSTFEGLDLAPESVFHISPPNAITPVPPLPGDIKIQSRPTSSPPLGKRPAQTRGNSATGIRGWIQGLVPGKERHDDEESQRPHSYSTPYSPSTTDTTTRLLQYTPTRSNSTAIKISQPPPTAIKRTGNLIRPVRNRSSIVNSVVGIRRTAPSPGADALIFGSNAFNKRDDRTLSMSTYASGTHDSLQDMPPIEQLGFPAPPSRPMSMGLPSSASDSSDIEEFPPVPRIPAAMAHSEKGHGSGMSNFTSFDVTSFIEAGNRTSEVRDQRHISPLGTSNVATARLRSQRFDPELSDVASVSVSATSFELPYRLDNHSGELTPTFSDLREVIVTRAVRRQPSERLDMGNPDDFNPRPLGLPNRFLRRLSSQTLPPRVSSRSHSGDTVSQVLEPPMPESPTIPLDTGSQDSLALQRSKSSPSQARSANRI